MPERSDADLPQPAVEGGSGRDSARGPAEVGLSHGDTPAKVLAPGGDKPPPTRRRRRRGKGGWPEALARLLGPLAILVWATVLFWPTLTGDHALFWHDVSIFNTPLRTALRRDVAAGKLPLWSWDYGGGYPVGADPQSGLGYPLQAFDLTGLISVARMYALSAWLHFALAGLGVYVLLGLFGLAPAARLLAALGYMGSGFLAGHVMHEHVVWAAAWLPWALAALRWLWRRPGVMRAIVAGLPLGLAMLAGHPQFALYVFVAYVLWAFVAPLTEGIGRRGRALLWALGPAVFGLWLGVGPYLAGLGLVTASTRAMGGPHGGVYDMALDPRYWLLIVQPFLYGSYANNNYFGGSHHYEVCGYLAAPVLVLGLLGLVAAPPKHRRLAYSAAFLAVVALFMAAARQNPLYHWLGHYPPLGSFRAAARWVMVFVLGWSLVAAVGIEALKDPRARVRVLLVGLLAVLLWAGVPVVFRAGRQPVIAAMARVAPAGAGEQDGPGAAQSGAVSARARAEAAAKYDFMATRLDWSDPYWVGLGAAGLVLVLAGLGWLIGGKASADPLVAAAVVACLLFAAVEGGMYAASYLPTVPMAYYSTPPDTAATIDRDPGPLYVDPACPENERPPRSYGGWARDGTAYYMAERAVMRPNRSVLWGVEGVRAENPLALRPQMEVLDSLVPALIADRATRAAGYRLLESIGVKWVITVPDHAPPRVSTPRHATPRQAARSKLRAAGGSAGRPTATKSPTKKAPAAKSPAVKSPPRRPSVTESRVRPQAQPVVRTVLGSGLYRLSGAEPVVRVCDGRVLAAPPGGLTAAAVAAMRSPADVLVAPPAQGAAAEGTPSLSPKGPGEEAQAPGNIVRSERGPDGWVTARVSARRECLVATSMPLYADLSATVDGARVEPVAIDGYLAGVWVTPGSHVVTVAYGCTSFWQGIWLYLSAWLALLIVLVVWLIGRLLDLRRRAAA